MREGVGDGREHALARMSSREAEHALDQANGADATRRKRVCPLLQRRPDARTLTDEAIDKRLLSARRLGLAAARGKDAIGDAGMDRDERVVVEDAYQVGIPPHAQALPEQRQRHRIERARDLDVAIGVHGPLATGEEWKALTRERLQRRLLDLDEVRRRPGRRRGCRDRRSTRARRRL